MAIECKRCGKDFEGKRQQKYCEDLCRELAKLERDFGVELDVIPKLAAWATPSEYSVIGGGEDVTIGPVTCTGNCCKLATKNIMKTAAGIKFRQQSGYAVKIGVLIDYCPFCGGRLT